VKYPSPQKNNTPPISHHQWAAELSWQTTNLTPLSHINFLVDALIDTTPLNLPCFCSLWHWKSIQNQSWALVTVTLYFYGIYKIYLLTGTICAKTGMTLKQDINIHL
jgi:hypothetical protein